MVEATKYGSGVDLSFLQQPNGQELTSYQAAIKAASNWDKMDGSTREAFWNKYGKLTVPINLNDTHSVLSQLRSKLAPAEKQGIR